MRIDEVIEKKYDKTLIEETQSGRIIKLVQNKGFGFIETESLANIFFHATGVISPRYKDLKEGMTVEYIIAANEKGQRAIAVVAI